MSRWTNESTPPGDEFTAPGAEFTPPEREIAPCGAQFAPPPAEFAPVPGLGLSGGSGKKRHKWRFLLYVAAMAVFLFILFGPQSLSQTGGEQLSPGGPVLSGDPTPLPGGKDVTPAPSESPEPTPEPTPEPEPEPECKVVFVAFSSMFKGRLVFTPPERFHKAFAELYDRFSDTTMQIMDVDFSELNEDGEYDLAIRDIFDYWSEHPELYENDYDKMPDPVLRVTYIYYDEDGNEVEEQQTATAKHMLGYGIRYVENAGDFWGEGEADSFVLSTWENEEPIRVAVNGDPEKEEATLFVTAEVNGIRISEKDCNIEYSEDRFEHEGEEFVYYYATLNMHRPSGAPAPGQGGKVLVTVIEPVEGLDFNWKDEIEFEY